MTERRLELSRRRVLAGLGTIGVASAGAGLGTSAYFSDTEEFTGNQLTAGSLDMQVAASEYYSDWSEDEAEFAGMASSAESTDVRLPAPEGSPDARDIALDLDDETENVYEQFVETLRTGDDINGGVPVDGELCGTESDADGAAILEIDDVKPGDFGGAQFAFELCDNPGYLWLNGILEDASENGVTEPEADDPDEEAGVVELLDEIQVAVGVGGIQDSTVFEDTQSGFQPTNQQSLREFLADTSSDKGIPLSPTGVADEATGRECFAGSTVGQVSVLWWLPVDHANQIQTDSATFRLGFYTEQCRHNDGSGQAPDRVVLTSDATGGVRETDEWITASVGAGPTTTIEVEFDGAVYGDVAGEWPNNPNSYVVEAVLNHDFDGLAAADSNGFTDDFRIGYGGATNSERTQAGQSTAGGYVKRRQPDGTFVVVAEEDLPGFSTTESGDQLSYTFELDWTSDLSATGSNVGTPGALIVNEVFAGDGGEGVASNPSPSNQDGREDVDNTTDGSGVIYL
ncbi:SipW-dependent-type signal peptide-containing protein [Halobaculum sp. MBLA0147]|uniref:SipW-dependent-type signal peptide-containing protein n=1 Tax=Halobaculum sp. MBLA0147 TaxID=3079934 RepID=UPI00352330DA